MSLSRRGFLTFTAAAIAASVLDTVPKLLLPEPFNKLEEYGRCLYMECGQDITSELAAMPKAIDFLKLDAQRYLPEGTRYEIVEAMPMDFGRKRALAWLYSTAMMAESDWDDIGQRTFIQARGIYLWHRLQVGSSYEA